MLRAEDLESRPRGEHITSAEEELLELRSQVPGRWVDAGDLREGDVLLLDNGQERRIERVTLFEETQPTYNFAVDDLHNYAVGNCGVLVHNMCQPRNAKGQFTSGAGGNTATAAQGRAAHTSYRNTLPAGYEFEQIVEGVGRSDAVHYIKKVGRELKPDNPRAIARGLRQVERYRAALQAEWGGTWVGIVDVYRP